MPILLSALAAILSLSPRGCTNPQLQPYAGRWLLKSHGKNMILLTIRARRDTLSGTLVGPKNLGENSLGEFNGIFPPITTRPLTARIKGNAMEIVLGPKGDRNRTTMKLSDKNHLQIAFFHGIVPDWEFERISTKVPVEVSTDWPTYDDDPKIVEIRQQLQAMAEEDQAARKKPLIDPNETDVLAAQDGPFLESIFKQYGWPKISVFDVIPSDNFWLLVQHQLPAVQEEMLPALKKAVDEGEASSSNYAYLFDRVQTNGGKPQHWGTQAKCDSGHAVLYPVDEMPNVNERRKSVGLGPLDKSLTDLDELCKRVPN